MRKKLNDIGKIFGILIAIPGFIIALIILTLSWWTEGLIIEELLNAFNVSPILIVFISIIGIIILVAAIFTLIKSNF